MTQKDDTNMTKPVELNGNELDNTEAPTELDNDTIHDQQKVQVELRKKGEVKTLNYNFSDQGPYVVFIDMLNIPVRSNGLDDVRIG